MYDQGSMPIKYPRNAIEAVQLNLLPPDIPSNATVQLCIALEATGIKARDLARYLSLIDHFYGRLDPQGLVSYAHRKEGHVELSDVRAGSVELIISEVLESGPKLVFLYIVLKYLPEFIRNLAGSFKDIEEARFTRLRRRELGDRMKQDAELAPISDSHKYQIVQALDRSYLLEPDNLPGAQRLAREKVRSIKLRIYSPDPDDQEEAPKQE
ncbi:MAG: hypothetical protein WBB22_17955 [Anaerolineae bacterium]